MALDDSQRRLEESDSSLVKSLNQPLLDHSTTSTPRGCKSDDAMFDPAEEPPTTSQMTSLFCRLAIPAVVTNFIFFVSVIVNTLFAGHMNDPSILAAVGLTNVTCYMMVLSLMIGLNSAQETLTSQAFGLGNKRLCSVYLNRGRLILTAFFIPLAFVPLVFGEGILVALGQDPVVAKMTQTQLWYQMPSIFFYGHYDLYKRWLACMRITFVPMVAMFGATFLHIPLCFLFVNYFDMGIKGLGLASSIKDGVLLISVMIYGNCSAQIRPVLALPDGESFTDWCEYLKISLPSTIMICAEWWAFEILVIMAGNLSVPEQAAQTVVASLGYIIFMFPLGIQEASSGIIGNCIGSNNVALGKRFFSLITKINSVLLIVLCIPLFYFRSQIIFCYTDDGQVHGILMPIIALLALCMLFDGSASYLQGPIRALGLQKIGSCSAIGCYYVIGLPLAWFLAFKLDVGVIGLQYGITSAGIVQILCYMLILLKTDWQGVADHAIDRIEKAELKQDKSKEEAANISDDFTKVL